MIGGSASGGRSRSTLPTRSRTSCAAASMSRSRLNVIITNEEPWPEIERSWSMPSTVLTASSMRWLTSVSTSSTEAPGRIVRTETVGTSTEGKRSTRRCRKLAMPTTTSVAISIEAKTGRRMKVSTSRRTRASGLGDHAHAGAALQVARLEHELRAGRDALQDLDAPGLDAPDAHAALERLAADHLEELVQAREAQQRLGRHHQRARGRVEHDRDARERARPQRAVLVRQLALDRQRAVLRAELGADARDPALDLGAVLEVRAQLQAALHARGRVLGHVQAQ